MTQRSWWMLAVLGSLLSPEARGQQIGDDDYLRYVPLDYPRLSRQAQASVRFQLFGDLSSPNYRDVAPVDGIDDARGATLLALSQRFAPFMVQNTFSAPMDHRKLMGRQSTFNLFIDTWDLASGQRLVGRETLDMNSLGQARCPADGASTRPLNPASADCRVVSLLGAFDPDDPTVATDRVRAVDLRSDTLLVLFFDFPGHDPATWREAYRNPVTQQLRSEYHDAIKAYSHPFIDDVIGVDGVHLGFKFVMQYWFYYPLNDGGNNHEGDWEHIDVLVTPRSAVGRSLSESEVRAILAGRGLTDDNTDEQLVIDRVEYYFHHQVMTLDYAQPNVYAPRAEWERQVQTATRERFGVHKIWANIRRNAYRDSTETVVNTHPIAYIGADNKGLDQLLSPPGGTNRDSHGTFPLPGLYKTVGPAGSAEQIRESFDHWQWFADPTAARAKGPLAFGPGHVTLFDEPNLIEVMPDWERVLPLVRSDPVARRNWAWLVLPVRWGYPATPSPLAGLVANADMGNVGPIGPAYNSGWNRTGTGRGFEHYNPHSLSSFFPVEAQDGFSNNLGFFNLLPALGNLPPFDLIWRVVGLPFRALFKRQDPIYFPEEDIPSRFVGIVGGASYTKVPEEMWSAVINLTEQNAVDLGGLTLPGPLVEIVAGIAARDTLGGGNLKSQTISDAGWGVHGQFAFYVGSRFVSTTGFRHSRNRVGVRQPLTTGGTYAFDAEVNWWDLTGNIRYNIFTGGFKPYGHFGYGVNWYRLENMTSDGVPFSEPTAEWIYNFWPLTWQYGVGAEFMLIQSFSPIPRGIDLGVKAEYAWLNSPLGVNVPGSLPLDVFRDAPTRWVRKTLNLSATVSF